MRRLIKSTHGQILDIPVNVCSVQVKLRKPIRGLKVWWPVIRMEDWAKWMLNNKPQLLLGGNALDHKGTWKETFYRFWELYRKIDGSHPVFQRPDFDLGCCIPYFFHGDEGRGQLRRPYMVISWQCAISHLGPQVTNDTSYPDHNGIIFCAFKIAVSFWILYPMAMEITLWNPRHTFTTRYLFSGISSHLYYGQWTVDDLLGELANEAIDAFEGGVYDPLVKQFMIFFFILVPHFFILWQPSHADPVWPLQLRRLMATHCAWSTSGRRAIGPFYAKHPIWK